MGKPVDFRNYQLTADFQSFAVSFADFLRHKKSVPAPEETEFAVGWSRLSSTVQDALMSSRYAEVYQVVIKAVPINYAGDAVSLVPPEHNYRRTPVATSVASWSTRLGQHLSPQLKQRIRKGLNMLGVKLR